MFVNLIYVRCFYALEYYFHRKFRRFYMYFFSSFQFLHCTLCMAFRSSVKLRYLFIEKQSFTISSYPLNNLSRLIIVFSKFYSVCIRPPCLFTAIFFTVNKNKCICKSNNYMLKKFVNLQCTCTLYHAVYYVSCY